MSNGRVIHTGTESEAEAVLVSNKQNRWIWRSQRWRKELDSKNKGYTFMLELSWDQVHDRQTDVSGAI